MVLVPKPLTQAENDELYDLLAALVDELPRDEAEAAMARLILILANQVGDFAAVRAAIAAAREAGPEGG